MSFETIIQAAASAAPAFDADTATRAYLATLNGAARVESVHERIQDLAPLLESAED